MLNDLDPGVRQSALWAYGFTGAADAQGMLANRSKEDTDVDFHTFQSSATLASRPVRTLIQILRNSGAWAILLVAILYTILMR